MKESRFFAQARTAAGMTQASLAHALGYDSAQFISNIERGLCQLPNNKVRTFCVLTGCSVLRYVRIKMAANRAQLRREIFN